MISFFSKQKSKEGGFTILESLVSTFILILVVTATFAATRSALSNSIFAKDQVAAFFLANEAVEYLRNTRDTNIIGGFDWLLGFSQNAADPCYFGKACTIDATANSGIFTSCSAPGSCPVLRRSSGSYLYGYDATWTATNYRREVRLTQVSANEILATVTVTFSKGPISKTVTIKESIFNWQ
jgi:type II secretory pathway pseudopilin PulG